MPDQLTLDVIDRPGAGLLVSTRHLSAVRRAAPPDLRALIGLGTGRFVTRMRPAPTPRRIAVLTVWEGDAGDELWERVVGPLCRGAREHWHVRGEVTRAAFTEPWRGWVPHTEDARPLADDEPALILISGDLHARFVPAFFTDVAPAVGHAFGHPGYLGGLAVASSLLNTTSCSAWRTYGDARAYAYRPGGHADAMRRDRAGGHHRTEWFLRVRPLEERGTLAGRAPFGALLGAVVV